MSTQLAPKALGEWGEEIAARYLKRCGYDIVGRGILIGKAEIDILADLPGVCVIVEVKTVSSDRYGNPEDKLTIQKVNTLSNAAEKLLLESAHIETVQFDLITIIGGPGKYRLKHWEKAF